MATSAAVMPIESSRERLCEPVHKDTYSLGPVTGFPRFGYVKLSPYLMKTAGIQMPATSERNERVDPRGAGTGKCAGALDERDHELRSALCGIEAVAQGLNGLHDRLTTAQLAELTAALVSEARRMQSMLTPTPWNQPSSISPRPSVRSSPASEPWGSTFGWRSPVGSKSTAAVTTRRKRCSRCWTTPASTPPCRPSTSTPRCVGGAATLYVEDDGIGITSELAERLFERGGAATPAPAAGMACSSPGGS